MRAMLTVLFTVVCSTSALAQVLPPPTRVASLAGPRVGVTFLEDSVRSKLAENGLEVNPVITQFGWQVEKQFYAKSSGMAVLNEWVLLLGGLEQSLVLPSVSWMVGIRSSGGSEFGFGPNFTATGVAFAIAGGTTFRVGPMNVPVNVAVVPSKVGMRVSFLTGFTLRR